MSRWPAQLRSLLLPSTLVLAALLFAAAVWYLLPGVLGMLICDELRPVELVSSDGRYLARSMNRSCGLGGFYADVYLRRRRWLSLGRSDLIYSYRGDVVDLKMRWQTETRLEIEHSCPSFEIRQRSWRDVTIMYRYVIPSRDSYC